MSAAGNPQFFLTNLSTTTSRYQPDSGSVSTESPTNLRDAVGENNPTSTHQSDDDLEISLIVTQEPLVLHFLKAIPRQETTKTRGKRGGEREMIVWAPVPKFRTKSPMRSSLLGSSRSIVSTRRSKIPSGDRRGWHVSWSLASISRVLDRKSRPSPL